MDRKIQKTILKPDYKRIYNDLIDKKYPEKKIEFKSMLEKKTLSTLDIIKLNQRLFGEKEDCILNQKHRSYDKAAILEILDYQKINKLNNKQLALKFNMSRNTIGKWKKIFL
ncbi:helix-turn-helix domain-containing protein [Chryseobacterium sp.]|uniref:helix-turn-helix domain-containing protein n=1 Tax=Chryseobacterium sp. TaxID=1871047 RepID=UPI000EE82D3B|nr:helix-turn-helix domain-containing protein [Chryseobacterium sp.]HCM36220.1 transposase [Chryseobacterium sp.]